MRCGRRLVSVAIATTCAIGAAGCAGQRNADSARVVTVFGGLIGEDAQAFVNSLRTFERNSGIDVRYVGSSNFESDLQERVRRGDAPDLALVPQPGLVTDLAEDGYALPYDGDLARAAGSDVDERLLDLVRVNGDLYASWYSLAPKSLVWYSPRQFAARGLQVPTTWDDLLALTDEIAATGQAPWCIGVRDGGATGWVATDWVEDLVLRREGPDVYDQWVAHDVPFSDERIAGAVEAFGAIALDSARVAGGNRAAVEWTVQRAAQGLLGSKPACLLHRQASFLPDLLGSAGEGVTIAPDGDLWVFPFPDDGPSTMLVGGTVIARFSDRPEVRELAAYLASNDAAEQRAGTAGFITPLESFDLARYPDALDRTVASWTRAAEVVKFDASDLMPAEVGVNAFWDGMTAWLSGARLTATLGQIDAAWPASLTRPTPAGGSSG